MCVLAFNVVEALFPAEDPIGKTINVGGQDFTVVGTVKKQKAGPFGSENQEDNDVFIPYWTFHKMFPSKDDHFIIVRMREGQMKEGIDRNRAGVCGGRRNVSLDKENDFEIGTPDSFISTFDDIVGAVFGVMLIISSIAFMVGGVGVMNIMLVAVTERTREIGIRKAVGAQTRRHRLAVPDRSGHAHWSGRNRRAAVWLAARLDGLDACAGFDDEDTAVGRGVRVLRVSNGGNSLRFVARDKSSEPGSDHRAASRVAGMLGSFVTGQGSWPDFNRIALD